MNIEPELFQGKSISVRNDAFAIVNINCTVCNFAENIVTFSYICITHITHSYD